MSLINKTVCFLAILSIACHAANSYKNGFGWDSGLSYRRLVSEKVWIGISLSGKARGLREDVQRQDSTYYDYNDSAATGNNTSCPYRTSRNIGLAVHVNRVVMSHKNFGLGFYVRGKYQYLWDYSDRPDNSIDYRTRSTDEMRLNQIIGEGGISPNIIFLERLNLETRFGIAGRYEFGYAEDEYFSNHNTITREILSKTDRNQWEIYLVGRSFSLNMGLTLHFLF